MNKITAISLAIVCIALAIVAVLCIEPKSANIELPSSNPSLTPIPSPSPTLVVPDDYPTLSDAVHNASEGATIFIKKGTYETNENPLVINKTLSIIGEDAANTVLKSPPGNRSGFAFLLPKLAIQVNAEDFKFSNVTITNSDVGISVTGNGAQISNIVTTGIIVACSNSNVSNSNLSATLTIRGSSNNVFNNSIGVIDCSGSNNTICGNTRSSDGQIVISNGCSNIISNNSILWFGSANSNSSKVYGNSIGGMGLEGSFYNKFIGNTVKGSYTQGIELIGSSSNVFYGNTISDYNGVSATNGVHYGNAVSIGEGLSTDNSFYCNNFINNYIQIRSNGASGDSYKWDNGSMGNYWSDYSGLDGNGDGIGSTPYLINNGFGQDRYPLIAPFDVSKINFDLIDLNAQSF